MAWCSSLTQHLRERDQQTIDLALRDDEWGNEAQNPIAGAVDQQSAGQTIGDNSFPINIQFHALQ